jgi:transcriptional regulator with XRE-family HTH domain
MRIRPEFGRRFRQLTRDETQEETARKLGVSQSYVSRLGSGYPGSADLVSRICRVYDQDEAEWRRLAGIDAEELESESEEARLVAIATRAAEEALRRAGITVPTGEQRLIEGLRERNQKYGRPIPIDLSTAMGGGAPTVEQAEAILRDLDEQLEQGLI